VLREIKHVKQERGAGRRRWFESEGLDLVVWLDARGNVSGFQLCYEIGLGQHALTWRTGRGFAHSSIDTGDDTPLKNESPVLHPAGNAPWPEIVQLFDQHSGTLAPALRRLIRGKLAAGADRREAVAD
jgi:hypothetical protein